MNETATHTRIDDNLSRNGMNCFFLGGDFIRLSRSWIVFLWFARLIRGISFFNWCGCFNITPPRNVIQCYALHHIISAWWRFQCVCGDGGGHVRILLGYIDLFFPGGSPFSTWLSPIYLEQRNDQGIMSNYMNIVRRT